MPKDLKSIKNVEIFSAGVWNGDKYTTQDLDEMVNAFEENKVGFRPFLKLGHDRDQKILQNSGMPAAGWIGRVFRKGDKLLADFIDIPKKIFELIEKKAYRKVSSEIYWNINVEGKTFKRMLGAVALLGAENPGVMNLDDILANFGLKYDTIKNYTDNEFEIKSYNLENLEGESMAEKTEEQIKLEQELIVKAAKIEEQDTKLAEFAKQTEELEALKKDKEEREVKQAATLAELAKTKVEKFITELTAEKLCTPAQKPLIKELMQDKKEYKIEEKEYTKEALIKEILKLHSAADVNLGESSEEGEKHDISEEAQVDKYMEEHKCEYGQAVRAIRNAQSDAEDEDVSDDN